MQINELPTIPQAPVNADVMAIEVNGITYKVSKQTLASAILGQIGASDNIVDVTHGGTGATSASAARTALGVTPANIGAVAKSGDTMTGDLQFTSNITPATTPSSTTSVSRVAILDADGNAISLIRTSHTDAGAIEAKMIARRTVSGSTVFNELGPTVNADGSFGYKISNPSAFRTAAGAQPTLNRHEFSFSVSASGATVGSRVNLNTFELSTLGITRTDVKGLFVSGINNNSTQAHAMPYVAHNTDRVYTAVYAAQATVSVTVSVTIIY